MRKYAIGPKGAVKKKIGNQNNLAPSEDRSRKAQKTILPNVIVSDAAAPTITVMAANISKKRLPAGDVSIW